MGNVSILFCENEKFYTLHEVSALTGMSIRKLHHTVTKQGVQGTTYRTKNDACEVIVPLAAMEEFVCLCQQSP
jgi:hypothetical protein